jgi:hypothetical protein
MFRSLFSLSLSVEICCGGSFTLFVDDRGDTYSTGIVGLPSLRSKFEHKTDEGEEEGAMPPPPPGPTPPEMCLPRPVGKSQD